MEKKKKLISGLILAQIWAPKYFSKNLAPSVTRYHGQLSSCAILEKRNDPILRKLNDRWRDGALDRLTDRRVIS